MLDEPTGVTHPAGRVACGLNDSALVLSGYESICDLTRSYPHLRAVFYSRLVELSRWVLSVILATRTESLRCALDCLRSPSR